MVKMVKKMRMRVQGATAEPSAVNGQETLVTEESPDDFSYEGEMKNKVPGSEQVTPWKMDEEDAAAQNDVVMDSPDDL